MQIPSFAEERRLEAQGYRLIAGVDEVGRGALAGPVVAAAVILPGKLNAPWLEQIRDSKQLSPMRREFLFHHLHEAVVSVGIGVVQHEIVDAEGIVRATQLAMNACSCMRISSRRTTPRGAIRPQPDANTAPSRET